MQVKIKKAKKELQMQATFKAMQGIIKILWDEFCKQEETDDFARFCCDIMKMDFETFNKKFK